ncbi:conserved hypothetical protein [Nitrosotalea sinensis]|uniref:Uncharacterized protein n=1 Tax=Nitrosotalea sinensis TaxID=1499975 RepID=A0A2H1EJD1_9ARCH|nr:hypothetical protein [Candidatus Nitrosotalea sinensis]SHO48036.1 conserved hypothetical protein [Candidatus Nitrosotalea sinensis]
MSESPTLEYILLVAHLVVGFLLVFFSAKAFTRTKYKPMILLAIGFTLLVLGETVVEYAFNFLQNENLQKIIEEGFEIAGFAVLILAVKKS